MSLTEVPDLEFDVVVLHRLHVEPDRCSKDTTPHHVKPMLPKKRNAQTSWVSEQEAHLGSWRRPPPSAADLRATNNTGIRIQKPEQTETTDPRPDRGRFVFGVAYRGWSSCRHCLGRGRGCGPRGFRTPTRRAA